MPEYNPGWHHGVIAGALQRMLTGNLRRLVLSMPPRHGKSELISRRLPAYLLGIDPATTIIGTSYSADLASRLNRDIQRIIDSPSYRALFPGTRLNDSNSRTVSGSWLRNSDVFEIVGQPGTYRSAGVGGGITGMGAKWLIIDDPLKNREEADSPTVRENVWDWYTSTLYTRQAPDARILLVMTRWHSDDLAGRLVQTGQDEPQADQWEVVNFPAIAEGLPSQHDTRQPGEPLWPEMFDADALGRIRASIGAYDWAALYQQQPRAGGGVEWPASHTEGRDLFFDEWPACTLKTMAVDPSKGREGRHGDYSAIVKLGRAMDGTLYCEADLARRSSEQIIEDGLEQAGQFKPDSFAVETNQFQELLANLMAAKARQMGMILPLVQINNIVNKMTRIRRLGPYLEGRQIRFKANSQGTRLLIEQLRDFPVANHDDGPDALEMALRCMIDLHNGRITNKRQPVRRLLV
jgi:predicted phage terminase large subunit-like protein